MSEKFEKKEFKDKNFDSEKEGSKEKGDKKAEFEKTKKIWNDIYVTALEVSPESNKNGKLKNINDYFNTRVDSLETRFVTWDVTKKEKDDQMKEITSEYIWMINSAIWTQEAMDASNNDYFNKAQKNIEKTYLDSLEDFNKKMKEGLKEKNQKKEHVERGEDKKTAERELSVSFNMSWFWISFETQNNDTEDWYKNVKP